MLTLSFEEPHLLQRSAAFQHFLGSCVCFFQRVAVGLARGRRLCEHRENFRARVGIRFGIGFEKGPRSLASDLALEALKRASDSRLCLPVFGPPW